MSELWCHACEVAWWAPTEDRRCWCCDRDTGDPRHPRMRNRADQPREAAA